MAQETNGDRVPFFMGIRGETTLENLPLLLEAIGRAGVKLEANFLRIGETGEIEPTAMVANRPDFIQFAEEQGKTQHFASRAWNILVDCFDQKVHAEYYATRYSWFSAARYQALPIIFHRTPTHVATNYWTNKQKGNVADLDVLSLMQLIENIDQEMERIGHKGPGVIIHGCNENTLAFWRDFATERLGQIDNQA